MNTKRNPIPTIAIILILSLVGGFMIHYSTVWGPWAFSDSTEYIVSARNLLAGRGLGIFAPSGNFKPLTLHPPLYPLILSAMGLLGCDLLVAARWLNVVLFGLTISLVGIFTYQVFKSAWIAICCSVVLLTTPALVDVSSGAMSELLFLFLCSLAFCLLTAWLVYRSRGMLILSAAAVGLACLARYPGIILAVVGIIALLLTNQPWKQRINDVLKFGLISLAPLAGWLVWVFTQTGTLGARAYHFTLPRWSDLAVFRLQLVQTFWNYLPFQEQLPTYSYHLARNIFVLASLLILALAGMVIYKFASSRQTMTRPSPELVFSLLWLAFGLGMLLLLIVSSITTNLVPSVDERTLLPVLYGLAMALLALFLSIIGIFRLPKSIGWVGTALVLAVAVYYGQVSWKVVSGYHSYGAGYTNKPWHESKVLQQVRAFPPWLPVITNQSSALLLLLDRPAYDLCTPGCDLSGKSRYGDDPRDPAQVIFQQAGAALVIFYPYCGVQNEAWYADTLAQYQSLTQGLAQYYSSCDGEIYFYPSAGSS